MDYLQRLLLGTINEQVERNNKGVNFSLLSKGISTRTWFQKHTLFFGKSAAFGNI